MDRFITFEGGDGCGKTTQSKKLYEYLKAKGQDVIWTREIGGTDIAEKIRDLVVSTELLANTELLLILAARNEHIESVIKPAIEKGQIVICDRFIDSTAAYQAKNHQEIKKIFYLNQILFDGFLPHKTFYLDLDPNFAVQRAKDRGEINKYELKDIEFHKLVYSNYQFLLNGFSHRIKSIDASKTEEEIFKEIISKV